MTNKRTSRTPRTWPLRQRDNHPALVDTSIREAAIVKLRFTKAKALVTVMLDEGLTLGQLELLTDESWEILRRMARVNEPSLVTRILALELLRDRLEQKGRT